MSVGVSRYRADSSFFTFLRHSETGSPAHSGVISPDPSEFECQISLNFTHIDKTRPLGGFDTLNIPEAGETAFLFLVFLMVFPWRPAMTGMIIKRK